MAEYQAPLRDMGFLVEQLFGLDDIRHCPALGGEGEALFEAILDQSARFSQEVLSPLNREGDRHPAQLIDGRVQTPPGFKAAYEAFIAGGWNGLTCPEEFGGQGLPQTFAAPLEEMWHASNMAFTLGPLLTRGAIEAIRYAGTPEQQQRYLPALVDGRWSGTMNLTEPQAGSDLAGLQSHARGEGDHYRLKGQKIFITYGDQDWTENTIHLVLARLPDAPPGVKGVSLFIVPKYLITPQGQCGERNEVTTVSLEHKLGIHGSPTCAMSYGDDQGAWAELLGPPHHGVEQMFVMMNAARFSVGVQGVAIADRAYQGALHYAQERVQGQSPGAPQHHPILYHPDVLRMLSRLRARIEAARALAYYAGHLLDLTTLAPSDEKRHWAQARSDLLTPIVKGHCTELGVLASSEALQVYGGMGFIEDSGAPQFLRDARICTIYEGTTGIQANDLLGRKLFKDRGLMVANLLEEIGASLPGLSAAPIDPAIPEALTLALKQAAEATHHLLSRGAADPRGALGAAVPYLQLLGLLVSGWLMARSAVLARARPDDPFMVAKYATAVFHARHVMPETSFHHALIQRGGDALAAMLPAHFTLT